MTSSEEIIALLQKVPLFSALKRPQLRELAAITHEVEHAPGAIVCRQGQLGEQYFIVQEGRLRISRIDPEGRPMEIQHLEASGAFGETSLLLGDVRDATAEAITPTVLLYIEKAEFDQLLAEDHEIEAQLQMRKDIAEERGYPRFSWLDPQERPVKVLRRHPAVLIPNLFIPLLFAFLLILLSIVVGISIARHSNLGQAEDVIVTIIIALGSLISLVPLGYSLYTYIDWRNDLYVVTNRRVIHRERIGLIRQQSAAVPFRAIQDIQQVQIGLVSRIFRYGSLIIETPSGRGQVVFNDIPRPDLVRDIIFEQRARAQALARAQERDAIRQAMHRHFLGEGEDDADETAPAEEDSGLPGCLMLPFTLLRFFLPPTWHRQGETVTWRKHWIALLRAVSVPLIIFVLVSVIVLVVFVTSAASQPEYLRWAILLYSLVTLFLVPWLLWQFEDWQNDFYQVTATRIIDVERSPLLLREERREANLEQITSVQFTQSVWGRILGYGNVTVETAAQAGTFTFDTVSRPQNVQSEIFNHIETARQRQQEQDAEARRAEMLDWFSIYDEIKGRDNPPPDEETM